MAIVRPDKRSGALDAFATMRKLLNGSLVQADTARALLDDMELNLGLATEGDLAKREAYLVVHMPPGEKEGHELGDCEGRGCLAAGGEEEDLTALGLADGEDPDTESQEETGGLPVK
jgi:hypothetical protein